MRPIRPTLAHYDADAQRLELEAGHVLTREHRPKLRDRWVGYCLDGLDSLRPLLRKGDRVISSRGGWSVVQLRCDDLTLSLYNRAAWELSGSATDARAELALLKDQLGDVGHEWAATAATVGGRLTRKLPEMGHGGMGGLRPRWRALAHAAVHPGPMAVTRGHAVECVAVDRRKAFLRALDTPVGIGDPVLIPPGAPWSWVRGLEGIVYADVEVPRCEGIPGLVEGSSSAGWQGGGIYPTGSVRGTWSVAVLEQAERCSGVRVVRVHEGMAWVTTRAIYQPVREELESWPKLLKRLVYCRFWGRLASTGGWSGTPHVMPDAEYNARDRLWWGWSGVPDTGGSHGQYRPDHSALLAGTNAESMVWALAVAGVDAFSAYVDCVWTTPRVARRIMRADPDGWAVKKAGPCRWYGLAAYVHGDVSVCAGWSERQHGPLTPTGLASRYHDHVPAPKLEASRAWTEGSPAHSRTGYRTTSLPVHRESYCGAAPSWKASEACWSYAGWLREPPG